MKNCSWWHVSAIAGYAMVWSSAAQVQLASSSAGPAIVMAPQPLDLLPGQSGSLMIGATGAQPLFYQWRLNGDALPSQTRNALFITNAQLADGGAYSVKVWNSFGTVTAGPALVRLLIGAGAPPASDSFADRPQLKGLSGAVQSTSVGAGLERSEPDTKGGGRTVWIEWTAPADGVAAFSTQGSGFDTLLDVFIGTQVGALMKLAEDDDAGGRYTSQVHFNAQREVAYQVRVDGFDYAGTGGNYLISWELKTNVPPVPVLRQAPTPQGAVAGGEAVFRVVAGNIGAAYQWFFNGSAISGATAPAYTVKAATGQDVGLYMARVYNGTEFVESQPVGLQLTSGNAALFELNHLALVQDKFQSLTMAGANGNRPGAGWVSIGLGDTVAKQIYSLANGQDEDPDPCGAPLFGTLYQGVRAEDDGVIQVDTMGSAINARMAVYRGAPGLGEVLLVCDLTSALMGQPCVAKFDATEGTNYAVIVEGYQDVGNLQVTCKMGTAPLLLENPRYCLVALDGAAELSMPGTNWCPEPVCQWRLNGANLVGETQPTLQVQAFNGSKQGSYSVVMSNFVRVATNTVAYLALAGPFVLNQTLDGAKDRLIVRASNAAPFVLERSFLVTGPWEPVATNMDPCLMWVHTNGNVGAHPARFFRAAPWP